MTLTPIMLALVLGAPPAAAPANVPAAAVSAQGSAVTTGAVTESVAPELAGDLLLVIGAEGTPEYGRQFAEWAARWQATAQQGNLRTIKIGAGERANLTDRDLLRQQLQRQQSTSTTNLWIVMIGHGTFDGRTARFNLRGPDVSAAELGEWLSPIERPVVVINCASASGPFVPALSRPGRIVVSATKSGFEHNFARFGDFLSAMIGAAEADFDRDGQTSLLEAFLAAAHRTREFYETEGRLETEHPLIDDNGDNQGTPPDWFRGVRAIRRTASGAAVDGFRAHQLHVVHSLSERLMSAEDRLRRDQLELAVFQLRERKSDYDEQAYLQELESRLIPLAELYEKAAMAVESQIVPNDEQVRPAAESSVPASLSSGSR